LLKVLSSAYPNHPWDQAKFNLKIRKSSQWLLYKIIKQVLPSDIELIEEYVHPVMKFRSGSPMVFDIYIAAFNLAFEYNGYQHYYDHYLFGNVNSHKLRDTERHNACKSKGITLIEVPYWWHCDKESVVSLLYKIRPDIMIPVGLIKSTDNENESALV